MVKKQEKIGSRWFQHFCFLICKEDPLFWYLSMSMFHGFMRPNAANSPKNGDCILRRMSVVKPGTPI